MSNLIYLQAFGGPPQNRPLNTISQALETLRADLAEHQPGALKLFDQFSAWMVAAPRPEQAEIDPGWLRDQFEQYPYWRCNELLDQVMEPCRKLQGTPSERLAGLRAAWPALRELVSGWAAYNGRPVLRGLARLAGWITAAAVLILIPTFFFDLGEYVRAALGS